MPHDDTSVDVTQQGVWRGVLLTPGDSSSAGDNGGVYPVHMILLHTGRVLMFSGYWENAGLIHRSVSFDPSGTDGNPAGYNNTAASLLIRKRWFVPELDEVPDDEILSLPSWSDDPDIDLFCSHHVQVEDGRILVVGGDARPLAPWNPGDNWNSNHDNRSLHFYDPDDERWEKLVDGAGNTYEMVAGRWYPTCVTLPDGSVVVFSGHSTSGRVAEAEVMSPPTFEPRLIDGGIRIVSGTNTAFPTYPGLHLARGGRIFYVPTSFSYGDASSVTDMENRLGPTSSFGMLNIEANPPEGAWELHTDPTDPALPLRPVNMMREEGTSILLSPAQAGRVLLIGGAWWNDSNKDDTSRTYTSDPGSCEILDMNSDTPSWSPAGQMRLPRINVNAVLLPDGKVLIFGGHRWRKWNLETNAGDPALPDERSLPAEVYDPTIPYDPAEPSAAFKLTGEMHTVRSYHSGGLLLPDGRVLVGGGEDPTGNGPFRINNTSQRSMEFYEPPYLHNGPRPVLIDTTDTGGPNDVIHYGGLFTILTDQAASILRRRGMVALMRPGSCTHHTDSEQRHIPLVYWPTEGGLRVRAIGDPSIAPPGWYMLWIVDDEGRPCERAKFVQLTDRYCRLVTDRSHFSVHEVEARITEDATGSFDHSLFVVVHGYRPSQLSVTNADPTEEQLRTWAPNITFRDIDGGSIVDGLSEYPMDLHLEVDSDLNLRQRITFEYGVSFAGTAMFPVEGADREFHDVEVTTTIQGHSCKGTLRLYRQPNPYMLDGPTHWLSDDLRVFQLQPGQSQSSLELSEGQDPIDYIQRFLNECDDQDDSAGHPFRQILTDQRDSGLELSQMRDDEPVYNFAVARVRYRSLATPADDVRVFFRLFTTAVTSMEYRPDTYPVDASSQLPEVGVAGAEVLTIPCFGMARSDLPTSGDRANVKSIPHDSEGKEVTRYFGAWLDFNQESTNVGHPGTGGTFNIQTQIRNRHQCLVAEINFTDDPIAADASPANSDNLAQRNLAIEETPNPGNVDSRVVQHTFDVRTTWWAHDPDQPVDDDGGAHLFATTGIAANTDALHGRLPTKGMVGTEPDELMILWGHLPRDAEATLYLPGLPAQDIVAHSRSRYGPQTLEAADDHTVRCRVSDVTFVPLPTEKPTRLAGLLRVVLPEGITKGETYKIVVRQVGGSVRRIIGTFEFFIVVGVQEEIQPAAESDLAVITHIAQSIPTTSRWYPVFLRYLDGMRGRVRGFGGEPARVDPSPNGTSTPKPDRADEPGLATTCRHMWFWAVLFVLVTGLLGILVLAGLQSTGTLVALALGAVLSAAFSAWTWYYCCRRAACCHKKPLW